ncbi:MAG TPA: M23 family metallopeptidase [Acidimicrobiia bacterium]|jgi:murein DD-endopeptidase MepM/ murein hydrolase activator NlpD
MKSKAIAARLVAVSLGILSLAIPASAAPDFELTFPQEAEVTEFTSSWGAARAGHSHKGNDLMAPKLTEVYAAADGVVVWIRDRGSAGRYIAIDHGDGWETWYMHLNNDTPGTDDGAAPLEAGVAVRVGDRVKAGQVIGWVGDSGNAEGSSSHTHFELHYNGSPIDPYPYLIDAFERALRQTEPAPHSIFSPI